VGTQVSPRELWNFLDPDVIQWRMESHHRQEQIAEFFELRLGFEPVAAQLIADHGDPSVGFGLVVLAARMRDAMESGDLDAFTRADVEFHATIVAQSVNQMFSSLRGIVELGVEVRTPLFFPFADGAHHGVEFHVKLADAIAARSPDVWILTREMLLASRDDLSLRKSLSTLDRRDLAAAPHDPTTQSGMS
jgi:DNA-binding FadR family transcriptional regulator